MTFCLRENLLPDLCTHQSYMGRTANNVLTSIGVDGTTQQVVKDMADVLVRLILSNIFMNNMDGETECALKKLWKVWWRAPWQSWARGLEPMERDQRSWVCLVCSRGSIRGESKSSLQQLEGELQSQQIHSFLVDSRWYKNVQWPQITALKVQSGHQEWLIH